METEVLQYMGVAYAGLLGLRSLLIAAQLMDMRDGKADWPFIKPLLSGVEAVADLLSGKISK